MTALPFTPQVVRVQLSGAYYTSTWANVFHVHYAGSAPTATTLTTFVNSFVTTYVTNLGSLIASAVTITLAKATDLTSDTGIFVEVPQATAGTHTPAAALTSNVALVVSWAINKRYRGGHPRTYLTGQDGALTSNSRTWTAAFQTTAQTQGNAFLTAVNAMTAGSFGPYTLGSVNYWVYGAHPPQLRGSGVFYPFQSATVHPRVDTQRRRLGKESF